MEECTGYSSAKRTERGSIDFEFDEFKVILDEKGKPTDIVKKLKEGQRTRLSRNLCLCATRRWPSTCTGWAFPLYTGCTRTRTWKRWKPSMRFIYNFGYSIKGIKRVHLKDAAGAYNAVKVKGKKEERVITHPHAGVVRRGPGIPTRAWGQIHGCRHILP